MDFSHLFNDLADSALAINSLVALMQFVHLQFMEGFCYLTHIVCIRNNWGQCQIANSNQHKYSSCTQNKWP